jgi:hypothetical protein
MGVHDTYAGSPVLLFVIEYFQDDGIRLKRELAGGGGGGQGGGIAAKIASKRAAPGAEVPVLAWTSSFPENC